MFEFGIFPNSKFVSRKGRASRERARKAPFVYPLRTNGYALQQEYIIRLIQRFQI